MTETIRMTKLDIARRQMETAIELYFRHGDVAAIHALAAAAQEILVALSRARGFDDLGLIEGALQRAASREVKKEFRRAIQRPKNFLKHADRDPDDEIDFNPEWAQFVLLDATWLWRRLTQDPIPAVRVFDGWAALTWGRGFMSFGDELSEMRSLAQLGRSEFYAAMMQVAAQDVSANNDAR